MGQGAQCEAARASFGARVMLTEGQPVNEVARILPAYTYLNSAIQCIGQEVIYLNDTRIQGPGHPTQTYRRSRAMCDGPSAHGLTM